MTEDIRELGLCGKKSPRFWVVLLSALFFLPAKTTNAGEMPWLLLGFGNTKCSIYTSLIEEDNQNLDGMVQANLVSWAYGFFSGMNLINPDREIRDLSAQVIKPDVLKARVLARCYEEPSKELSWILAEMYGGLKKSTVPLEKSE